MFCLGQAQILGRASKLPGQGPAMSKQLVRGAAAKTEAAVGEKAASVQSRPVDKVQAGGSVKGILMTVDINRGDKQSPEEAVRAPGTPKLATPVKRPVSADLPREAHAPPCRHLHKCMRSWQRGPCKATLGPVTESNLLTQFTYMTYQSCRIDRRAGSKLWHHYLRNLILPFQATCSFLRHI